MRVYARTDVGLVRPINEDSYLLPGPGERFCAVADGMGGHNAGEVASAMAVEAFARSLRAARRVDALTLHRAVLEANATVLRASREVFSCRGMGTTFTALARCGSSVIIAHVGDSRAYLFRDGRLLRVTTDHTLVEELVREGFITPLEASQHPRRNIITRALGTSESLEVDIISQSLCPGDLYLLCTDGLSNHVTGRKLLDIAYGGGNWMQKASAVVDAALRDGGTDNITAMFVTFGEERRQ